jgi:hypothetical protein
VPQEKQEQEMPSLSLLPENEVLATTSCGLNLYPKLMKTSSKIVLTKTFTSDKHVIGSSCLALTYLKQQEYCAP